MLFIGRYMGIKSVLVGLPRQTKLVPQQTNSVNNKENEL